MLGRLLYPKSARSIKYVVSFEQTIKNISDVEMIYKDIGRETLISLLTHFCPGQVINKPLEDTKKLKQLGFEFNSYLKLLPKLMHYIPDQSQILRQKWLNLKFPKRTHLHWN